MWQPHWLEAQGDLGPWRARVAAEIQTARQAVARILPPPAIDILVQRGAGTVIPEIGMLGRAWHPRLFSLTLDPDNPHFARCLADGALRRQVAHEAHHCLRMAGPGYGRTLGEALVSEGLAGQFTRRLFASPPEPWEQALDDASLHALLPDAAMLAAPDYDHAAWFFGNGGQRPRWYGYTLGFRLVGDWLAARRTVDGDAWVNVSAATVLGAQARWKCP